MGAMRATMDFLRGRRRQYQLTFKQTVWGQNVLADLAKFCRANETCVVPGDQRLTDVLEGRREVWLRIQNHIHLTDDQLYLLLTGHNFNPQLADKEEADA
jgi:hypothetical protein